MDEIRRELEHDIGKDSNVDPLWLAELHRQRFGEDALMRVLRHAVPNERLIPGPLHHALRAIRWRAILTGNYDTLLEKTFEPFQRVRACVDDIDLVRSAERDTMELIHLHGVIDRPDTIVLALEDYRRYPDSHPGMLAKVRQLFLQHPVLFVGFGVTDPNFMQWTGWLSDVVGNAKNPWVNLTLDPPPSLSHGRYWGTRLDFISVRDFRRFRDVVPSVLRIVGEALHQEDRSEEVAQLRIRAASSASEVVREVRELLDVGNRSGAEGAGWDHFRVHIFDAAASHVLDLAAIPWREPNAEEKKQTTRGITIEVDFRPAALRAADKDLLDALIVSFGPAWTPWCSLVREHFDEPFWSFHRIDPARRRLSDVRNMTTVPLDGGKGEAPKEESASKRSGDPTLDALRSGDAVPTFVTPKTAAELRLAGYVAIQMGQWRRAARLYLGAATASRVEFEPLRVEWLTLRSLAIALETSRFRERSTDDDALGTDLQGVQEQIRNVRMALNQMPADARVDTMLEEEADAERKLSRQLLEDLGRIDVDRTVRLGNSYGNAARSLDRLERLCLAPPLIRSAAEVLGTLQWRYGARGEAALTLSRYGSERLGTLTQALARSPDSERSELGALIPELLRHGRWPGEWTSRAEALLHVLPACTTEQLASVQEFVTAARRALTAHAGFIVRGASSEVAWSARAKIERVEAARWRFLSARDALAAIETWTAASGDVQTHGLMESRALEAIEELPWKSWSASGDVDGESVQPIVLSLVDGRLTLQRVDDNRDLEALLDLLLTLLRANVLTAIGGSPVRGRFDALLARVAQPDRDAYVVSLATIEGNRTVPAALASAAVETIDTTKPETLRGVLDVIAAAGECPDSGFTKLLDALTRLTDQVRAELAEDPGPLRDRWDTVERARLVGFVVGRLLVSPRAEQKDALVEQAAHICRVTALAAEHLTTVSADVLGSAKPVVDDSITELLTAAGSPELLSRRNQQFAGLRALVRALVQRGPGAVASAWLVNACLLARSASSDVAQYAAWIVGEWVARRPTGDADHLDTVIVIPALQAMAADHRIGIRANGVRGLVAMQRATPSAQVAKILSCHADDSRIAIKLALAGIGYF